MTRPVALAVLAAVLLSVAACGQKGPLYLPDDAGTVVTRPGTQTPTPGTIPEEEPETAGEPEPEGPEEEERETESPRFFRD